MDWLRNVLKGPSSSSSNFDGECYRGHEDSEEDDSLTPKNFDEENDIIDMWLYADITEEELALSLQQSLNVENRLPYDNIGSYTFQPYASTYREWDQYGHSEINYGPFWNTQTADQESVEAAGHHHFKSSFERPDSPILCDVCNEPVPVDSFGNPKYKEVPIFRQKYCRKHKNDGTTICFACKRAEPRGTTYLSYSDGREICGDCRKTAVVNRRDCQPLIDEILKFYEDLDMKVWQEIPVNILDKNAMNEVQDGLVRGVTTSSEYPLITTIQTPRFGEDNRIIGVKKEHFKLVSNKHVESIRLLNGCPRLYIGRTLAHEMMHAWIRLEGYAQRSRKHIEGFVGAIPSDLEEGVCQVMAHIWIESKIREMSKDKGSSSHLQFERKLAKQIKHSIETNPDPVYGDGFRLAQRVVNKYGLKGTLNYVRLTGRFPE